MNVKTLVRRASSGVAAVLLSVAPALAQGGGDAPKPPESLNVPYDGRFTFVRIWFTPTEAARRSYWKEDLKWDHDYPRSERHFTKIISEVTSIHANTEGFQILNFGDKDIFKYPVAYVSEPGYWGCEDKELAGFKAYLQKGGFVIFDDFVRPFAWVNFSDCIHRAFPEGRLVRLDVSHPIFDSFFKVNSLDNMESPYRVIPEWWGMYEDNDPKKRLMLVADFNNDLGDYWEWSDTRMFDAQISNEAYKLGINYIVYAMTR